MEKERRESEREREKKRGIARGKAGNLHLQGSQPGIMELKRGGKAINFRTNPASSVHICTCARKKKKLNATSIFTYIIFKF